MLLRLPRTNVRANGTDMEGWNACDKYTFLPPRCPRSKLSVFWSKSCLIMDSGNFSNKTSKICTASSISWSASCRWVFKLANWMGQSLQFKTTRLSYMWWFNFQCLCFFFPIISNYFPIIFRNTFLICITTFWTSASKRTCTRPNGSSPSSLQNSLSTWSSTLLTYSYVRWVLWLEARAAGNLWRFLTFLIHFTSLFRSVLVEQGMW